MPRLVALAMPPGAEFVDALRRTWDAGDAAFPLDLRLPPPARTALLAQLAPAAILDAGGRESSLPGGRPTGEDDALVVATSGTTGEPKGAVLTHDAVAAAARITSQRLGVDPAHDHWLACLPLAHVGGLSIVTRALATGTPLTVLPGFDPEAVKAAARAGCTLVSLVATAMARIDTTLFRTVLLGGSAPPADLPENTVATYGMTETGGGVVYDGIPLDGVDISLTDEDEILLRSPTLARAYRTAGGETPLAGGPLTNGDVWYATGDIGRWEATGTQRKLAVAGRADDMITTGGEKVWPSTVESVLSTHPAVAEVAVTGHPDPEWGERIVAYVVPTDPTVPPNLDTLRSLVKEQLSPWAAPKELLLLDSLPRTAIGKIRRATLPL